MSTSIVKKWDLTIESPAKVMRALEDILHDDLLYPSVTILKKPELVGTAIEGTASFKGEIIGVKQFPKRIRISHKRGGIIFALLGILAMTQGSFMLAIGLILLIVGIILLIPRERKSQSCVIIDVEMEGESYKAGVGKEVGKERDRDKTERIGVISDARLTIYGKVTGEYGNAEIQVLNFNMDALVKKVETELIPRFQLPEIK